MKKRYVLAIRFYFKDGWYGTRKRYIYAGSENGFETKKDAKAYVSMLKKFLKNKCFIKETGQIEIEEEEKMETYRYCGAGPSWSCSNVKVNVEDFHKFIENENKRLEENKRRKMFYGN